MGNMTAGAAPRSRADATQRDCRHQSGLLVVSDQQRLFRTVLLLLRRTPGIA
jgi:hypothetical protein